MVKTRTDLEHEIEELTKELDLQRDLKVKAELECEKLRQGLQNALVT